MATATKTQIPAPPPVIEVTLTLTGEEAQCLADILASVGGTPNSRRRFSDQIRKALAGVGYDWLRSPYYQVYDGGDRLSVGGHKYIRDKSSASGIFFE